MPKDYILKLIVIDILIHSYGLLEWLEFMNSIPDLNNEEKKNEITIDEIDEDLTMYSFSLEGLSDEEVEEKIEEIISDIKFRESE